MHVKNIAIYIRFNLPTSVVLLRTSSSLLHLKKKIVIWFSILPSFYISTSSSSLTSYFFYTILQIAWHEWAYNKTTTTTTSTTEVKIVAVGIENFHRKNIVRHPSKWHFRQFKSIAGRYIFTALQKSVSLCSRIIL